MAARVEPRKVPLTGEVSSGSLGCRGGHVRGRHCESARRIVAAQPTPSRLLGAHFADHMPVNTDPVYKYVQGTVDTVPL